MTAVVAAGQLVHAVTMHEFPPAGIVYGLAMALAAWSVSRSGGRLAIGFAGALNGFELFNMLFVYGGPAMLANPSAWQDFVRGALGGHDDGPQAGEARITMRDFAFQPAVVHVAPDSGLFVENLDPTRHDITIDGDVIVDVPGHGVRRTDIALAAGHHVIICSLHPSMTGAVELASP